MPEKVTYLHPIVSASGTRRGSMADSFHEVAAGLVDTTQREAALSKIHAFLVNRAGFTWAAQSSADRPRIGWYQLTLGWRNAVVLSFAGLTAVADVAGVAVTPGQRRKIPANT